MYRGKANQVTVAVASAGTTATPVIRTDGYAITGIITPATLTSTAITFTACTTATGTFVPVYDSDGSQVSVAVAADRALGLSGSEADALAAWPFIKLVCGSAEGGDRTFAVCLK